MNKKSLVLLLSSCLIFSGCTQKVIQNTNDHAIASFDKQSITLSLNELIQVNIDSFHVYNNAIKKVKDPEIKKTLSKFATKHEEHVRELSKHVIDLGGHPPSFSRDFKGFLTSGYVNFQVARGKLRTLEAIETNEIISNRYYNKALSLLLPRAIKSTITEQLNSEKCHLSQVHRMKDKLKIN